MAPVGPSALVQAIREDPEDRDRWLVYGDWLLANGDPRGELVTVGAHLQPRDYRLRGRYLQLLDAEIERCLGGLVDGNRVTREWMSWLGPAGPQGTNFWLEKSSGNASPNTDVRVHWRGEGGSYADLNELIWRGGFVRSIRGCGGEANALLQRLAQRDVLGFVGMLELLSPVLGRELPWGDVGAVQHLGVPLSAVEVWHLEAFEGLPLLSSLECRVGKAEVFRAFEGLAQLRSLSLVRAADSGSEFFCLEAPTIKRLKLSGFEQGMPRIMGSKLEALWCSGTPFCLERAQDSLHELRALILESFAPGVELVSGSLKGLKKLERLRVAVPRVDEQLFEVLAPLKWLKVLRVRGGTEAQLGRLREALPDTEVSG